MPCSILRVGWAASRSSSTFARSERRPFFPSPRRGRPRRRVTLAAVAERPPTSGSYDKDLGKLRTRGLIDYPGKSLVALTDAGEELAIAPEHDPTLEDLQAAWRKCPAFEPRHVQIIDAAIDAYPGSLSRTELAAIVDRPETSGSFDKDLGKLRTMGLIDYPAKGHVKATELLFPAELLVS